MARYWVYLNDEVVGPYSVEQLIRLRGFSRQTQICVDDHSGKPGAWSSPADIPELAHIFKAVDEWRDAPAPAPPKSAPKPQAPRAPSRSSPAPSPNRPNRRSSPLWWFLPLLLIFGAAGGYWFHRQNRLGHQRDQAAAQLLVETMLLPANSLYANLRDFLDKKHLSHRWNFERTPVGLWNVSVSVYGQATGGSNAVTLYAFEVNLQAQIVRALNSAASRLLAEGFPSPAHKPANTVATPPPTASPAQRWKQTMADYKEAIDKGNFKTVWEAFSARKRSDMLKAGISREGFVRVQSLTHGLESGIEQTLLKTKDESDSAKLVLWKQSRPDHPDIYVKQTWIKENGDWKLDDEEKRTAGSSPSPAPPAAQAGSSTVPATHTKPKPNVLSLPGLSN